MNDNKRERAREREYVWGGLSSMEFSFTPSFVNLPAQISQSELVKARPLQSITINRDCVCVRQCLKRWPKDLYLLKKMEELHQRDTHFPKMGLNQIPVGNCRMRTAIRLDWGRRWPCSEGSPSSSEPSSGPGSSSLQRASWNIRAV